mgnify:CR=1 FL=1|tara:strand:- start:474 stop:848 length:375 start_codon:yes stop_codon:yes gene_type:complete
MAFIADILLVAGALGAGLYCHVLSRRLRRFTDLEKGVGGAVAVLSAQVDDLAKALSSAQSTATSSVENLASINTRAEASARKLELLIASMHDVPDAPTPIAPKAPVIPVSPFFVRRADQAEAAQ